MTTRPDPPTNIVGIAGNNSLTISWIPASTGGPVSSFTAVGFGLPTNISKTVSSNIFTTTLQAVNGRQYIPRVFANGPPGSGSSIPLGTTIPSISPPPPTNLRVVYTNTTGNAQISWTPPTNQGGADITSYKIYSNSSGSAIIASTATTSITVNGFTYGTPYTFTATAINSVGESLNRSAASAPFTPLMLPTSPINVAANMISSGMRISWETPASTGGTPITGYTIQNYTGYQNYVAPSTVINSGEVSSIILSTLSNGTTYNFGVRARNIIGLSPHSDFTTNVLYYNGPTPVFDVTASQISTTSSASVSWLQTSQNASISSFNITTIPSTTLTTTSNLNTVVSGLTYGVSYRFSVTATNERGTSPPTSSITGLTPLTVPDAPPSATATFSGTSAIVSWTSPTFNGGASISGYRVTRYNSSGNSEQTMTTLSNVSSLTMSGLTGGNSYVFGVTATNIKGISRFTLTGTFLLSGPPGIPTNVTSISKNTAAILNWTPSENIAIAPISSYIFTTSPTGGSIIYYDSSKGYAVIGGLTNGLSYTVTLRAVNSAGSGPRASTIVSTTSAVVIPAYIPNPGLVTGPRIYAKSGDYISIFAGSNFQNFSYAIPIGTWSTMTSISQMTQLTPGTTNSTLSGNISVVFPEVTNNTFPKLLPNRLLTLNNGENNSGATTVTYLDTSAATLLSGANGQFPAIPSGNWDYARSITMSDTPSRINGTLAWVKQLSSIHSDSSGGVTSIVQNFNGTIYRNSYDGYNSPSTIYNWNKPIVADYTGCYILYKVKGTISGQSKAMYGFETDFDIAVARFNKNGSLNWVQQKPTFNTAYQEDPIAIVADTTGCYVLYNTTGAVSAQRSGSQDVAIARFSRTPDSSNNTLEWVKQDNTFNADMASPGSPWRPGRANWARGLAADSTGCYVLSETSGTINGPRPANGGGIQTVVSRFSKDGTLEWARQPLSGRGLGVGIVADSTGCYIMVTPDNGYSASLVRMNKNPTYLTDFVTTPDIAWILGIEGSLIRGATHMSVSSRCCYITYMIMRPYSGLIIGGLRTDIIIACVNQDGTLRWRNQDSPSDPNPQSFNTVESQAWPRIAADSTGCYLLFRTNGTVTGGTKTGEFDAVVARFSENGDLLWIKQGPEFNGGNGASNYIDDIVADDFGCTVLTTTDGAILGKTNAAGASSESRDVVISRFTKEGVFEWASQSPAINTPGTEYAAGIALGINQAYVVYTTDNTVPGGQRRQAGENIVVASFT